MAQNAQHPQQPHQQRPPAMPLMQPNPLMTPKLPVEHQQWQQQNQPLQQPYFYGPQSQPQMGVLYSPQPWYPQQEQPFQGIPPANYQYWYSVPQHVNSPQVCHLNPVPPGIISSSLYRQANRAQKQLPSGGQPPIKPATKAQSRPACKVPAQAAAVPDRTKAGGRVYIPQKTSADCSLNRIDSISKFRNNKRSHSRGSEEVNFARTHRKMKLNKPNQGQEKEVIKKELDKEKEEDTSLSNGASSLFRRIAQYMRFRSARKARAGKKEKAFNDIDSQGSSSSASAKKHGFLSRLFGETQNISAQYQPESHCHAHYPTKVPISSIDQDEVREAEGFQKHQADRQSRKHKINNRLGGK